MSKECGGCNDCGSGKKLAALENKLASLNKKLSTIEYNTNWLKCGSSPIIQLWRAADVASFSTTTGLGSGNWAGWALANGDTYIGCDGKEIVSPNLLNKFLVGGGEGSAYAPGTTGGLDQVTLVEAELPAHTHAADQAAHTHTVTDPGHVHALSQEPHTHAGSVGAHNHAVNLNTAENGSHNHETGFSIISESGSGLTVRNDGTSGVATSDNGAHTHAVTGNTDNATPALSVTAASVDIDAQSATTGISLQNADPAITVSSAGEGVAHENRPPFYAVVYVFKL